MSDKADDKKGQPPQPVVQVNGKQVDLRKAFPLTVGDWKRMEREQGITSGDLQALPITRTAAMVLYVMRKANSEVAESDVDALPLDGPAYRTTLYYIEKPEELDIPFSTTSMH